MTKKLVSLLLALVMALSVVACGGAASSAPASSEPEATAEPTAEPAPELVPAYSVEGYETIDSDGNRITDNRTDTSDKAMAVASKYEVSQVGAEIMSKGGNAVDAAVAMGFALGVCEPFSNGIGGGGIATIHTAEGENIFIDFRETAPAGATLDLYLAEDGSNNGNTRVGGLASGVPGEVAGMLYMLENYGSGNLTRAEVMEPAIRIAEEGFTVSAYCAGAISDMYELAVSNENIAAIYLDEEGLPYEEGDVITNPTLGAALRMIAEEGGDAFYKGAIGEAMIESVQAAGGVMTMEDLAGYEALELEPVVGDYRGYTIISSPPPSSGGSIMIEILNMLENYDIASMEVNGTEYVHLFTEAYKLAFADRAAFMADTAFTDVPLDGLTNQDYADERAALIDLTVAQDQAVNGDAFAFEHSDTTHYSVADAEGNCVAITKTINYYWGSGVMCDRYGFFMNNQMDDFSTNAESVNKIEPGKKPLSSMSPTVVLDPEGDPFLVIGTPGGTKIFCGVLQTISRIIDHGMDPLTAICVPKVWNSSASNNLQYETPLKGYEEYAVSEETVAELTEMGHGELKTAASGAMQTIMFQEDGTLLGVGDPRQDGKAAGVN